MALEVILGLTFTVIGILATYHIAFKQGVFKKKVLYLNIEAFKLMHVEKVPTTDLIVIGIPKHVKEDMLIALPILYQNLSKEGLKNACISVGYNKELQPWTMLRSMLSSTNDYPFKPSHDFREIHFVKHDDSCIRVKQKSELHSFMSFNASLFNISNSLNVELHKTMQKHVSSGMYLTDILIQFLGENIDEQKILSKLVIIPYENEETFFKVQVNSIVDAYARATINDLSILGFLKTYTKNRFSNRASIYALSIAPNLVARDLNGKKIYVEYFPESNYDFYEKRYPYGFRNTL